MSSPEKITYSTLIAIDREAETAVFLQIAHQLINAVQRGYIPGGTQLPGTRVLATLLSVHRKTTVAAYEELEAQGWIIKIANKGSFIKGADGGSSKRKKLHVAAVNEYPAKTGFLFTKNNLLEPEPSAGAAQFVFTDGQPDYRLSPTEQLARYYTVALRRKINRRHLGYGNTTNSFFKNQLSNYLNSTRGLHIAPKNILVTRGMEMGMYVAAQTLLKPGDVVLVASPGYYKPNMIFQQSGAVLKSVPVDDEGVDITAIERICKKQPVRMLYITPHHHYPTTVSLSAGRRVALLNLAATCGFIILEDDYEYDFQYASSPVLPLASADAAGMVVYLGSFGKTLAPGFRTGFLLAPENLIIEMQKQQSIIDQQGDSITEQVLAELIAEGEIHRHLKKAQKIYHQRRDHFCTLLEEQFSQSIQFVKPSGGLAVWTEWTGKINLLRLSKASMNVGIQLPQTLLYQTKNISAVRMGFGNFTTDEASLVLSRLSAVANDYALFYD